MGRILVVFCVVLFMAAEARAQQGGASPSSADAAAAATPGAAPSQADVLRELFASLQGKINRVSANHYQLLGRVDMAVPGQTGSRIFADAVDFFFDTNLLVASGNVAFTNPEGRITAEKLEFKLGDGTAVFYDAQGMVRLPDGNRAEFGNQDPDVYFWGDQIDKLGPKKYRITRGGFTACVQPTPRWEVTVRSIDLNLDDYVLARSAILRVKGVPLLYLPALYYPLQEEQRSTGFLMPTYGTSTIRGASLSNAFFWALGRSQDATFFHDWFARAGHGAGAEYRYVADASSSGEFRLYRFSQRQADYSFGSTVTTVPSSTSYEARGSVVHNLGPAGTIRGRVEYATNLLTQQLYQQNVYRSSNPIRMVETGYLGYWGALSASALYQRTEVFRNVTDSDVTGSTPRFAATIAPTRMFGLPIYGSASGEYAYLPYYAVRNGEKNSDNSMARFELAPAVRVPLSTLTFLTVNSTASYRTTYFSRSLDLRGNTVAEPVGRSYFSARSEVIGPVFSKIWDTPERTTIDRMKHVIEPVVSVDYVTDIANARRLPSLSHTNDVVIGDTMRVTYGINNRLFYRQRRNENARGSSQEFLTIGVQQTYYSNPESSRWDYQYGGSTSRNTPVDLSPIAVTTRFSPTNAVSANSRLEYDVSGIGLQMISLGGSLNAAASTASVSFSRTVYRRDDVSSSLTVSNSMQFMQGRATGTYALSWDIGRSYIVSQSVALGYLAQCCGVQVDFQQYNYPESAGFPLPSDRRLNFGFVLAGLGTFTNFFGGLGGQQ